MLLKLLDHETDKVTISFEVEVYCEKSIGTTRVKAAFGGTFALRVRKGKFGKIRKTGKIRKNPEKCGEL